MIRITKLESSIELQGQSSYGRRIRGTFTIECCGDQNVEIAEGHIVRADMSVPPRLLVLVDSSPDWMMSEKLRHSETVELEIRNETERLTFSVEKAVVHVIGYSDEQATAQRCRGQMKLLNDTSAVVEVYEAKVNGRRKFYLDAPREVLLTAKERIDDFGECILTNDF